MGERMPCLAYITCLLPVIGAGGYGDDIAISSWTLSRYRDSQKVHDSSRSIVAAHWLFAVLNCSSVESSLCAAGFCRMCDLFVDRLA